jgi:peptidyl-prolyl cis-trans isomerase A (cyclophilin A)
MNKFLPRILAMLFLGGGATSLSANPVVCFEINLVDVDDICLEMLPEAAPGTVANFLRYVDDGDYANSMVHRSVQGFVIQGGAYSVAPTGAALIPTDPAIVNEYNQPNLRGTVAMARIAGNANSATSQWFINIGNNTFLDTVDGGFTVFARVVSGMEVADLINALPRVGSGDYLHEAPYAAPAGTPLTFAHLIRVVRAYRLAAMYQCSSTSPGDTLTEFCGSTVTFPVLVSGVLYEGTLEYIPGRTGLVFSVDKSKLKLLTDTGQERATFAAGVLTIPSVRNGAKAFDNVTLQMTSSNPLEFTVTGFTPR